MPKKTDPALALVLKWKRLRAAAEAAGELLREATMAMAERSLKAHKRKRIMEAAAKADVVLERFLAIEDKILATRATSLDGVCAKLIVGDNCNDEATAIRFLRSAAADARRVERKWRSVPSDEI
jgi:hypothetical protein